MAESNPTHDHISFQSESITGAQVCDGCGTYVLSRLIPEHQAFHDKVQAASAAQKKKKKSKKG